jgi:hypothetical protein
MTTEIIAALTTSIVAIIGAITASVVAIRGHAATAQAVIKASVSPPVPVRTVPQQDVPQIMRSQSSYQTQPQRTAP